MHGENGVAVKFAEELEKRGYDAIAPNLLDVFDTQLLERKHIETPMAAPAPMDVLEELHLRMAGVTNSKKQEMEKELELLIKKWDEKK